MTGKTTYFEGWSWFKFNKLGRTLGQKVLEVNSTAGRSNMEKLVRQGGGGFLPPKFWIGLNELKWGDFFLDFIKRPFLQLTAGTCLFNYLYLSYAWEINPLNYPFDLIKSHALHFQVFNATDNLKATRATDSFLGLNKKISKLKIGNKSLFWHVFEKVFCHQFYF